MFTTTINRKSNRATQDKALRLYIATRKYAVVCGVMLRGVATQKNVRMCETQCAANVHKQAVPKR